MSNQGVEPSARGEAGRRREPEKGGQQERSEAPQAERAGEREQGGLLAARASGAPAHPRRTNPFATMMQLSDEMNRLMDAVFAGDPFGGGWFGRSLFSGDGASQPGTWTPRVDVRRRGQELVVCADLPGVEKDDVQLELEDDRLVIRGQRRYERESEEGGLQRSERGYGSFHRAIPLPEGADTENAQATMKNGVLELRIPLRGAPEPRRIPIQG